MEYIRFILIKLSKPKAYVFYLDSPYNTIRIQVNSFDHWLLRTIYQAGIADGNKIAIKIFNQRCCVTKMGTEMGHSHRRVETSF